MKPANVLLDENLSAKITDFGLAKFLKKDANYYTLTRARGTDGYIAPEFGMPTSQITNKCDVYSFGVLLFEVLGKRHNRQSAEDWFPLQVWTKFKAGKLDELIESFGIPETHKGKAKILSMVAFWCSQYTVEIRPSMSTVVNFLEKEISVKTPPDPFQFYSEASTMVHESLAISNPTLVVASDVFINASKEEEKKDKAGKDSDDDQAISNFSEQLQREEIKTNSEIEKLPSELETAQPQSFSLSDLKMFTSNFSEIIGSGRYGVVYKGQFLDGMEVVIKVLDDMEVFDETFMDVVITLKMVTNPNIIKLHGYCFDDNMKALVYDYIGNGSLDILLYRNNSPFEIEWEQLYKIAIETAKELSVLHAAGIIHHDIKASNILLDSNLSPKIVSYGLKGLITMKRDDVATRITGSKRNSSPDDAGAKSDVYSFGMLLFEVLGRRSVSNRYGLEWFPRQVWKMFNKGLIGKIMEDCGINKKDRKKAFNLSKVALWCAQDDPEKRPSMSSVVNMLEMKICVMDPPRPSPEFRRPSSFIPLCAGSFSRLEKPVMNPRRWFPKFVPLIARLPSIELSSVMQKFSCLDLIRFTSNFSEKIGSGTLDILLYGNSPFDIKWEQLYEIAIKIAKGLSALHTAGIIHHDIKASNILLKRNLSPKIRSSGLGRHFIMKRNVDATRIVGSYGYSAPETWIPTSEVTSKSDVYSFGMLLFEVLGRRIISNHRGQEWFPAQVWMMFDKGLLGKVREDCGIDKVDRKKAYNLSKVALWCAQFDPQKRPSMSSVVKMLKMKIPVMDPPNPFPYAQLSSPPSSPEVSPRFKASPSTELSYE